MHANYGSALPMARVINADLHAMGYETNMSRDSEGRIIEARKDGETCATFWETGREAFSGSTLYAHGEVWDSENTEWREGDWRSIITALRMSS